MPVSQQSQQRWLDDKREDYQNSCVLYCVWYLCRVIYAHTWAVFIVDCWFSFYCFSKQPCQSTEWYSKAVMRMTCVSSFLIPLPHSLWKVCSSFYPSSPKSLPVSDFYSEWQLMTFTVCRLLSLTFAETSLSSSTWQHAKSMECLRKQRIASI